PAGNAWPDALLVADRCLAFDAAVKHGADDAFVGESVSDAKTTPRDELRHSCRRTGAARRPINGFVAIEDRIASVSALIFRFIRPHDMTDTPDAVVLGMDRRQFFFSSL